MANWPATFGERWVSPDGERIPEFKDTAIVLKKLYEDVWAAAKLI